MKLSAPFILASLLLMILTGCRGDEPKRMPDTLPDVHGYISSIKRAAGESDRLKAEVMVRALEGVEVKYPEANIRIDENTLIESKTGEHLKLEQLREGHEIEAWFEGEVMESFPVQGYVKAVRVSPN